MVTMKKFYEDRVILEIKSKYERCGEMYTRTCYVHVPRDSSTAKTPLLGKITDGRRIRRFETTDHIEGDTRSDRVHHDKFVYYRYIFEDAEDYIIRDSRRAAPVHYDAVEDTREVSIAELKRMAL